MPPLGQRRQPSATGRGSTSWAAPLSSLHLQGHGLCASLWSATQGSGLADLAVPCASVFKANVAKPTTNSTHLNCGQHSVTIHHCEMYTSLGVHSGPG